MTRLCLKHTVGSRLGLLLTALTLGTALPSMADDNDDDALSGVDARPRGIEEVTVFAQRREQNSQDVGIAITAMSGEQINALGFTNAQEIAAFAPNVLAVQPNGEGNYSFAIRGVANNDLTTNRESPIAVYVDDMYISQMSGTGFLLFDMEGVEVLRGPQGTLFGRNATGGLVHFRTVKPSTDGFDAMMRMSLGSYDQTRIQGAVNVPMGDRLAARLSLASNQGDGYIENRFTNQTLNNQNEQAARLQVLFDATDNLSFLLNVRAAEQDIRTGFFEYISAVDGGGIPTPGVPNPLLGNYIDTDNDWTAGDYDFTGQNVADVFGTSLTVSATVGAWDFTSLTDYQTVERDYIEDTDATPVNYYNYFQTNDARQFSQEFRASTQTDRWSFVTGLFYLDLESDDSTGGIAPGFYADLGLPTPDYNANGDNTPSSSSTESFSVFGQAEYQLTEEWALIGGLRWITEEKDFISQRQDVFFPEGARTGLDPNMEVIDAYVTFDPDPIEDRMWAGRLQVNYTPSQFDGLLAYASYNLGVRSGGFSQPPFDPTSSLLGVDDELLSFDPEALSAYELGLKWDISPSLRTNLAAFYYDYEDYQAYTNFPGALGSATVNGQAASRGVELEAWASPTDRLDMRLGVGYTDIEVEDIVGFEGQTLRSVNTPEWNLSGLIKYSIPIGPGDFVLQADFSHTTEHYFSLDVTPATTEDGYTLFNALAGYFSNDGRWSVTVQTRNLTNERYKVQTFDLSDWIGMIEEYYGRPRWTSLNVEFNF